MVHRLLHSNISTRPIVHISGQHFGLQRSKETTSTLRWHLTGNKHQQTYFQVFDSKYLYLEIRSKKQSLNQNLNLIKPEIGTSIIRNGWSLFNIEWSHILWNHIRWSLSDYMSTTPPRISSLTERKRAFGHLGTKCRFGHISMSCGRNSDEGAETNLV